MAILALFRVVDSYIIMFLVAVDLNVPALDDEQPRYKIIFETVRVLINLVLVNDPLFGCLFHCVEYRLLPGFFQSFQIGLLVMHGLILAPAECALSSDRRFECRLLGSIVVDASFFDIGSINVGRRLDGMDYRLIDD